MNKYKTEMKREMAETLQDAIKKLFEVAPPEDIEDKMFYSLLQEVNEKLYKKLGVIQLKYNMSFTPAQAFALATFSKNNYTNKTTYLGNKLHTMSMQIEKQFNI